MGINLYAYVGGNPVNLVDPNGLMMMGGTYYFGGKPFNPWHFPRGPKGPFGEICGMETTLLATWIPDVSPSACKKHDDCYDNCGKNCEGYDCKRKCDDDLMGSNRPYGYATHLFGKEPYDIARRKYGCDDCEEPEEPKAPEPPDDDWFPLGP